MKIAKGYRVGKLTVYSDTGKRKNGYMVWLCRCDCGKEVHVSAALLKTDIKKAVVVYR